jgi:hypothetical protein
MSFLDEYLADLRQRQQRYEHQTLGDFPLVGGLLRRVAPGVAAAPLPASAAPFTGAPIGELFHQGDVAAQLLAGGGALAAAQLPAGLTGQDPASAGAVRGAAAGAPDPLTAAMAVETLLRRTNPALTTAGEMALNPLNYLPGGAEEALGRVGLRGAADVVRGLNEAQALPLWALGAGTRAGVGAVRGLLGPGAQAAERAVPEAEQVASRLAADVPPPPPTIAAPPRAPFTPETARQSLLDALGRAPLPARAQAIGALNTANFGGGAGNAMRAVTGGADLGALGDLERPFTNYLLQRTIEAPAALESLRTLHPGLHAAVDLLPDLPERTALDLQNEVRRAAGLPEKVVKPPRGAQAGMPAPEAGAPQEAAQAVTGATAGAAPEPWQLTKAQLAAQVDETATDAIRRRYAFHVARGGEAPGGLRARPSGWLPEAGPVVWFQPQEPGSMTGAVYALDRAAATPGALERAANGYLVHRGDVPADALTYLGESTKGVPFDTHRAFVEAALREGKPVPPAVLADYPDLVPKPTGGDIAAGGMGGQAPIQLATTLGGAAAGGLAGYRAAGDEASPTDRAAATLAGAAAGGTAGHLGPALLARPGESALRGIAAAGGGPVELAARGILGGDVAGEVLPFAREQAMAQHAAGSQVEALLPRLRQLGGIWARNVTQTARNVAQDETWLQFVLRGLQPGAAGELGTVRRAMADRLRLGTEWERYPTTTTAPLEAAGVTDATLNLGQTFHGTEGYLNQVLSNTQNAIGEAGLSALNPVRAAMNPLSIGFAGAKGYARNFQSGLFKAVNQFQQLSARHAVFADEFTSRLAQAADRFLPDLERRGYDVTPLRQKLAAEGAFSPDNVRTAMMGDNPAVQAWERTVAAVKDTAEARARKLLGDYSRRGVIERKAGGVVPFVSWQLRAWPVMAEMIATHPGAALAVGNLLRLSGQQVTANKEPIRNVGTIPIQTPAGTVRLNPLAAVAPGSPEMLTLGNEDPNAPEGRTAYQTASDLLQKVGLGFGPAAQALAYATSQDYKGPGPLSRTAGIENAIGQVPFVQLPSLGAAGLDAARLLLRQPIERVSAPAALPVAGAAQPDYDPNLRRAQEVYYDATGKAIGQPGTAAGAAQTLDPTSPLMARARGDVATSGALRNALSLVLPVGVQAQTPEAIAAQRARANAPISAAELARYEQESPELARLAKRRNAQYQATNPVAAIYEANTPAERKLAILHDWDRQHSGLLVDRKVFLARRQQVMDALGLKENATTRFDIAELAAPAR